MYSGCIPFRWIPGNIPVSIPECIDSTGTSNPRNGSIGRALCQFPFRRNHRNPAEICGALIRPQSRWTSCMVVATSQLDMISDVHGEKYLPCTGSLYGFGAFGLASQRSTICTHCAMVSDGNVAENFSKISSCLELINTASWNRFENKVPF